MAKRIVHQLIDDLDGTLLQDGQGETQRFGINGRTYKIDLSAANAEALRDALKPFIDAGRRSAGQSTAKPRGRSKKGTTQSGNVRERAASQGLDVPGRRRVPNAVLEAYRAAH